MQIRMPCVAPLSMAFQMFDDWMVPTGMYRRTYQEYSFIWSSGLKAHTV